jgi:hypothetical protein
MTPVSVKPRIVDFPDDLPFSEGELVPFRAIHRILAKVGCIQGISPARQEVFKKRRQHLLKILWALGRHGKIEGEESESHLVIDAETYLALKIQSDYELVKEYCRVLRRQGVHCEIVPLVEKGWRTQRGTLRKKGWVIKLSFDQDAGGASLPNTLQSYVTKLDEKYGKTALRYFSKADMRILEEEP